jgi:phage terminase large subunit
MNKDFKFLDCYSPIFYENKTYFIISGGRGSGKSTNVAAYFVMKLMGKEYFRGVIARFTQRALTNSIYRDIVDLITAWGLTPYIEVKNDEIICKKENENGTRNMIITHAFKMSDGTQTAKGKGIANPTDLLIDEAYEVPSEIEYIKLIDSFRTKGIDRKIFVIFNPGAKSHWIFKRWYLPDGTPNPKWAEDHCFIHTTFRDNAHNLDEAKVKEWERAAIADPHYYSHHILGEWQDIGDGQIFKTWNWSDFTPDQECEVLYGLDFGYSSDPTALIKVQKRGKKIWIEELLYEKGLTNEDIGEAMKQLQIPKLAVIYADSAEPKSIQTLRNLGYPNIIPAQKGPDSIRAGIDKILRYEVFASPNSRNLMEEYHNYAYRAGTGKPIDDFNHLMDAFRYAMTGVKDQEVRYAVQGKPRLKPDFF